MQKEGYILDHIFNSKKTAIIAVFVCSAILIGYGLVIMAVRVNAYPQFDVFEGKVLCLASDYAAGNKLYRDPALYPAGDIYTPIYPMIMSIVYRWAPPSFFWGRLFSALATLTTGGLMVWFFWRQYSRVLPAVIIFALFVAVGWSTNWFGSAFKPDAMCHLTWILGLAALHDDRPRNVVLSAVLLVMAFYVKQTAVFAIPGAMLFTFTSNKRNACLFLFVMALVWVLLDPVLKTYAGESMWLYIFGRAGVHSHFPVSRLIRHVLAPARSPLLLFGTAAAIACYAELKHIRLFRLAVLSLPFLYMGSVVSAASMGGDANSMMPAYYGMVFLSGFGISHVLIQHAEIPGILWVMALLLFFQIDPNAPYHISKSRGKFDRDFIEVVDFLKQQQGSMYAPSHNVLTLLAGRPENDDRVLAGFIARQVPAASKRVDAKINSGNFDWLICAVHENDIAVLSPEMHQIYTIIKEFRRWVVLKRMD